MLDGLIAQTAFENLLRGDAGQALRADPHVVGDLELGHVVGGEVLHVLGGERGVGLGDNHGRQGLTQALVGNTEHRGLLHVGVAVEYGFDFLAADVLAAPQHHVLQPVGDEDVAFLVDVADVPGMHPAVGQARRCGVRLVPVFREVHHAPDPQLAGFHRRAVAAIFGYRLHAHDGWHRAPTTARTLEECFAADRGREPLGLGHAPAGSGCPLGDGLVDLASVFGGHGRATAARALEARQIVFAPVRRLHQFPGHGRHAVELGNALRLDDAQSLFRVPLVHADELATAAERGQCLDDQAGHVEQRYGQDHGRWVLGLRGGAADRSRERRVHLHRDGAAAFPAQEGVRDRPVSGQHALGVRSRAGRVQDRGVVLGRDVRFGHRG